MSRPREFDENEVLEKANELFWAKGYRAATPQNLIEAMGLSKSSFYQTFGSKRKLFQRCLQRFINKVIDDLDALFDGKDAPHAFKTFYENMISAATDRKRRYGCLICNTATELSPHDKEAEAMVKKGLSRIEDRLCQALAAGQKEGTITSNRSARSLAKYLVSSNNGLQVMAKANPNKKMLLGVAEVVLSALR